jgi:hypothetical protein
MGEGGETYVYILTTFLCKVILLILFAFFVRSHEISRWPARRVWVKLFRCRLDEWTQPLLLHRSKLVLPVHAKASKGAIRRWVEEEEEECSRSSVFGERETKKKKKKKREKMCACCRKNALLYTTRQYV